MNMPAKQIALPRTPGRPSVLRSRGVHVYSEFLWIKKAVESALSTLIEQPDGLTAFFVSVTMLTLDLTWKMLNSDKVTNLSPQINPKRTRNNNRSFNILCNIKMI